MLPFQVENRIPGDFPKSVYCLLILQTKACCSSVHRQRNKLCQKRTADVVNVIYVNIVT